MLDHNRNTAELPQILEDFLTAERNPYTGQRSIMDRTDRPHYDKFCHGIIASLNPANPLETQLAFSIAADYWRLNRTRNIEDGLFASSHPNPTDDFGPTPVDKQIAASQTSAFLCRQSDFKFLSTYEMRIQRTLNRNKADLRQLQTERRHLESQPGYRPDDQTDSGDTGGHGFDFSNPPASAPEATEPAETRTEEPNRVHSAAQSDSAAPVFKANQQSGLIPTNTERRGDTRGNGFAFSKPSAPFNGAPQN